MPSEAHTTDRANSTKTMTISLHFLISNIYFPGKLWFRPKWIAFTLNPKLVDKAEIYKNEVTSVNETSLCKYFSHN